MYEYYGRVNITEFVFITNAIISSTILPPTIEFQPNFQGGT